MVDSCKNFSCPLFHFYYISIRRLTDHLKAALIFVFFIFFLFFFPRDFATYVALPAAAVTCFNPFHFITRLSLVSVLMPKITQDASIAFIGFDSLHFAV